MNNPSDAMKIVIPMFYGFQWGTWCITLVCLVSLRVSKRDPVVALEVQESKESQYHEARRSQGGFGDSSRMDQHLYNLRQSIISPHSRTAPGIGSPSRIGNVTDGQSVMKMHRGRDVHSRQNYNESDAPQVPERTWMGMERRSSSGSNAIFFPSDSRISQVVVTFRDGVKGVNEECMMSHAQHTTNSSQISKSDRTGVQQERRMVYADDDNFGTHKKVREPSNESSKSRTNKDLYAIKLSPSGDSLSDMIFKQPQDDNQQSRQKLNLNSVRPPDRSEGLTSQYNRSKTEMSNPARVRATATKASLTLSSDSSSSELSVASSSDYEDVDLERVAVGNILKTTSEDSIAREAIVAGLGLVPRISLSMAASDIIKSQDAIAEIYEGPEKASIESKLSDNSKINQYDLEKAPTFNHGNHPDGSDSHPPQMQPNSSDSSPSLSSLSSTSSKSRQDTSDRNCRQSHARNKPVLTEGFGDMSTLDTSRSQIELPSLDSDKSSPPESESAVATSLSCTSSPAFPENHSISTPHDTHLPASSTSTLVPSVDTVTIPISKSKPNIVSSPLQYWRNRSSSSQGTESSESPTTSFSQNYITNTFSKKKKPVIPTIVIHPDEEDGGPPRVLSQKEIDYLSTMIPPKLQAMPQPWEEYSDDEEYDDGATDDGYDYNEYHQSEAFVHGIERRDFNDIIESENEMESEEFDPFAHDIPIDIDVGLRETSQEQARIGYG
ncbi:hypothetical protein BGZ76_002494, partial [Entomortierella beljakovae]